MMHFPAKKKKKKKGIYDPKPTSSNLLRTVRSLTRTPRTSSSSFRACTAVNRVVMLSQA